MLHDIQQRVAAAAQRAGRDPSSIHIIGVSKRQPIEALQSAYDAGLRDFGENQAQEMAHKVDALVWQDAQWHFVGALQRNKVKLVAPRCAWIHSVDSLRLAEAIDRLAEIPIYCCVQVNIGSEPQKAGIAPEDLQRFLTTVKPLKHVEVRGLMCIPPATDSAEASRQYFRALRQLRDTANAELWYGQELPDLSMGMSHDFEVAIEEGATMIRVGTAIFGARTT